MNSYRSCLETRYASKQIQKIHSAQKKYETWRFLWTELARAQMKLGLPITKEQIKELESHISTIDFEQAQIYEKKFKHDVMAHIHTYADQCPKARPIIHLGATSCLITDNAEILIMQESLIHIKQQLITLIRILSEKAEQYKSVACLSYTHFQPAQPTTIGKRIAGWLHDFVRDVRELDYRLQNIQLLGLKGATGTQASFLQLFEGDHQKVKKLEKLFIEQLPCKKVVPIAGQTYTRKQDMDILSVLTGIAVSAHKATTDFRLLAHLQEVHEQRGKHQVGSTAMPYKHNPMRSERVCSLSRYIMTLTENAKHTAALQWFERTLDDSANRRLCIPESFLATDAILDLLINIFKNMTVHPSIVQKNLHNVLPFMATELILMACVKKGADRQAIHEVIRTYSDEIRNNSLQSNNIIQQLAFDERIPLNEKELTQLMNPQQFTGRAQQQVEEYIQQEIEPLLQRYTHLENIQEQIAI